jgi:hypothetical protein
MSRAYTRLELLKIRYAVVRNATGDTALARKASQWSNKRIEREFGVSVRKTELRPVEDTKRQQRKYLNYKRYVELGFEPKEAKKLKTKRPERIKDITLKTKIKTYGKKTMDDRKEQWREWCKTKDENGKNAIPPQLKELATRINNIALDRYASDDNARYGYAVVYYAYVRQMSIEDVMDVIRPERFSGDIYRYNKKI